MEYQFEEPPPIGTRHERYGNHYELIRVADCVTAKGAQSIALTWRGTCATCGETFETGGGLKSNGLVRRCDAHKGVSRGPATAEAKAACKAARKRGSATMKARGKAYRKQKAQAAKLEADLKRLGL